MTERSRDACRAAVAKFTAKFQGEDEAATIPTAELSERLSKGEKIVLVDVRTSDEQKVSMLPGAVSQDTFESRLLPQLQKSASSSSEIPLVVAYCTVGYRSGMYCRKLVKEGLPKERVRNGEGVLMWTFDGIGLVKPVESPKGAGASAVWAAPRLETMIGAARTLQEEVYDEDGQQQDALGIEDGMPAVLVKEVHVYGKPWDIAADGYNTIYFTPAVGAWKFIKVKLRSDAAWKGYCWLFVFMMFYLGFTPTCGLLFRCGCSLSLSKWGQVEPCNLFDNVPKTHKCPWCSCSGLSCIFVCYDSKAFRGIPLMDLAPDGWFVTIVTVLVLFPSWKQLERRTKFSKVPLSILKMSLAFAFFALYCITFGAIFFAASPDYPFFLGIERQLGLHNAQGLPGPVCPEALDHTAVFRSIAWVKQQVDAKSITLLDARDRAVIVDSLAQLGVSPEKPVVVYGDWEKAWGEEGRIQWMLTLLGHPNAYVMAGGLTPYLEKFPEQMSTSAGPAPSASAELKAAAVTSWDAAYGRSALRSIATTGDDLSIEHRLQTALFLVDTRAPEEYSGAVDAYAVPRRGHAVGAFSLPYADLFQEDGCLKSCDFLMDWLKTRGWTPGQSVVGYCTGGIRSAFFWSYAWHCGLSEASNYAGSMWEYADNASMPMTRQATPLPVLAQETQLSEPQTGLGGSGSW
eukprot:TRINITY_DN23875_c0_g3_i3.p1 TRINITY_DN23875_c0_g3~~TRINITY_DN23875_c0_g3_i3.p1  ORF type:complete len:685 (+),score=117.03 TRINITY_DN23875_c0_g3_i3:114-2168(+)